MRVFITGGSGFIGSAVVPELVSAGHQVLGLARSDASAAALTAAGAEVHRGELADLESLRAGAMQADGVIHLAFTHDWANFGASVAAEAKALETLGAALEGSHKPLVLASGVLGLASGRAGTEHDESTFKSPRMASMAIATGLAQQGVRVVFSRFAPTTHGRGDHGFMGILVNTAREKGCSAYIGDGSQRWPAVHRLDAAKVVRLGLERAPAGKTNLHAVAEEGVPLREVAEVIGKGLGVPVKAITPEEAPAHFGFLAMFLGIDSPVSNTLTRELTGWVPGQPGLLEDLAANYFA